MVSLKLLLLLVLHFAASTKTEAFILNSDVYEENSLLKWKFDKKCLANATVMGQVNEFKAKYGNLRSLRDEMDFLRDRGFKAGFIEICERKRDIARTVSDSIQSLADYCVDNSKIRKEFVLNTLLLLETTLDFICSMNQSHYEAIFELQSERCFAENLILLKTCVMKSFKFYFWEKPPQKLPTLIQLVNGSICNFDFDKLLKCSNDVLTTSSSPFCYADGAMQLLEAQVAVIKRNSLCFKSRNISDILDSSSENLGNIES